MENSKINLYKLLKLNKITLKIGYKVDTLMAPL